MISVFKYELNYRVKGTKLKKEISIDFIPNKRHEDFFNIQMDIINVQEKWNNIKLLEEEIDILLANKPEKYIDDVKIHKEKLDSLINDIKKISAEGLVSKRINLIKQILEDNGYSEDKELMSEDFWNTNVDPKEFNNFLNEVMIKDNDKKKVKVKSK